MALPEAMSNIALFRADQRGTYQRHSPDNQGGPMDDRRQDIDGTPLTAAIIGGVSILVLVMLKRAGFRFSFGVNVGR